MNFFISVRNHTRAPVNKAIGTYVASPIFRALMRVTQSKTEEPISVDGFLIKPMESILATSQKHSRGMFKNKPSHRYHARKDFFISREREELKAKSGQDQDSKKVPRVTVGQLVKLAIVPRVNAIINYKEGNKAVLNAGLHDIEEATAERQMQMLQKRHKMKSSIRRIASYEKEIEDLEALLRTTKKPEEKEKIEQVLKQRKLYALKLKGRLAEVERIEVDSVSTDAVSLAQHDKANKANISTVVRGFKLGAKIAASAYISRYIYEEIAHKSKTPDTYEYIPGEKKVVKREVSEVITETVPGMEKADVGKITLDDIYSKGSGLLTYDAYGGKTIQDNTSFFRGLAFHYEGKLCSGSDGRGFDPTVLTDVKIDQAIDGNTTIVSLIKEVIKDKYGKDLTTDEISDMIVRGDISGIDIWRSTSQDGVPMGWLDATEIVPDLVSSGSHEITKEVVKTVTDVVTTPGKYVLKPGVEFEYTTTELNPLAVAAELGLEASEISDLNEFLRFTRSQESIQRRQPRIIELMAKENAKKRAEKSAQGKTEKEDDEKGTGKQETTKVKKKREIKSFQRSNKSKIRYYAHYSEEMRRASEIEAQKRKGVTVFEGFVGTKKADLASGYDENLLHVNDREKPIDSEEGRD